MINDGLANAEKTSIIFRENGPKSKIICIELTLTPDNRKLAWEKAILGNNDPKISYITFSMVSCADSFFTIPYYPTEVITYPAIGSTATVETVTFLS